MQRFCGIARIIVTVNEQLSSSTRFDGVLFHLYRCSSIETDAEEQPC